MKKVSKRISIIALCIIMLTLSVMPAFAAETTYIENHNYIDCSNYYVDGSFYRYQVKVAKGTPLSAVTVKHGIGGNMQKLSEFETTSTDTGLVYQYTDSTSDCYLLSFYIYPGCPKDMWYSYNIKLYYDYNGNSYMATNTSNGSETEGPGYILTR